MLQPNPNSVARTQILPFERPYVSKKFEQFLRPTLAQCPIIGKTLNNHNVTTSSPIRNNQAPNEFSPAANEYIAPVLAEQLPLFLERELLSLFDDTRLEQAERVLEYLARAESKELDVWAQDDIRVAWLAVLYAARGFDRPWHYAFWCYYGKTSEKLIPIWLEQEAARNAMLGPGLAEGEAPYPAKKLPRSQSSPNSQIIQGRKP